MRRAWLSSLCFWAAVLHTATATVLDDDDFVPPATTARRPSSWRALHRFVRIQNTTEPLLYRLGLMSQPQLLAKTGTPAHGQPHLAVTLDRQLRTQKNKTNSYYVLDLAAGGFVGGVYDGARLYAGCRPPSADPAASDADELLWNFSENCRAGHAGLTMHCEVPLRHLATYSAGRHTGCCPTSEVPCGSYIYLAFRASARRLAPKDPVFPGADQNQPFDLWAQGTCIDPVGKMPAREKPLCDEARSTIAQFFKVRIVCEEVRIAGAGAGAGALSP